MASTLDLLNLLASGLGTSESINHMSGKTSASNDQVTSALLSALPSMLGQMKTNASTQTGASSLMSALNQHDLSKLSDADIVSLIKNADEKDGIKILNHLYGSQEKTEQAQASLAKQSGVSTAQMAKIMAIAAPALLTAVAAAKKKQAAQAQAQAQAAAQAAQAKKTSESDELMALLSSLSGVNTGSLTTSTSGKTQGGKKTSSAKESGMDLSSILQMAGALSGSTSGKTTTSSAKKNDGLDLGDILQMAGALSGSTSGKKTQQSSSMDIGSLMNLAGSLMGGSSSQSSQSSSTGMASLLGTLLQGKKLF
jgi:hypothetical protein